MFTEKPVVNGSNERDFGADAVRIFALILLLWLHFYLRNGFYYTKITDILGFIAVMFRPVFMCCVTLFMTLTGYLKCTKKWNAGYYKSLVPIICSWLLISAVHLLYKVFWKGETANAGAWILSLFQFKLANYSWYVGMYIGLFLISPLLNLIWTSCQSKKAHLAVIFTFVALTFLPSTVNDTPLGKLLPAYFQSIYYVTYYMIGCYIRTYRPKPNRMLCAAAVLGVGAVLAWINLATRTDPAKFYSGYSAGYNGLATGLMTTALFLLLYRFKGRTGRVRRLAAHFSGVVFEIYLLSYIADTNIYVLFYKKYPMSLYLPVGTAMTLSVFFLTYPMALCINRIVRWLTTRRF